jgi:tRNA1Val (adenine37-N6)-methyltransferase
MTHEGVTVGQQARRERVRAGWQPPPRPLPAGLGEDPALRPGPGESLDMLSGEFRLFQRKDGHRYSTDDLLAAWYACRVAEDCGVEVRRYVDLGSGIGSSAMRVAWKRPQMRGVAIEARALAPQGVGVLVHLLSVEARVREEVRSHGLELFRLRPVVFTEGREPYLGLYVLRWVLEGAPRETRVEQPRLIRTAARQRSPEYQQALLWMGFPP